MRGPDETPQTSVPGVYCSPLGACGPAFSPVSVRWRRYFLEGLLPLLLALSVSLRPRPSQRPGRERCILSAEHVAEGGEGGPLTDPRALPLTSCVIFILQSAAVLFNPLEKDAQVEVQFLQRDRGKEGK